MKTPLTVTSRGVVTIPAKLRKALSIKAGDQLIAEITPDGLLLRLTLPIEIYSENRIREFDDTETALGKALRRKKQPAR
jgi:AbrB family looped-hinge helix DNA binding protein